MKRQTDEGCDGHVMCFFICIYAVEVQMLPYFDNIPDSGYFENLHPIQEFFEFHALSWGDTVWAVRETLSSCHVDTLDVVEKAVEQTESVYGVLHYVGERFFLLLLIIPPCNSLYVKCKLRMKPLQELVKIVVYGCMSLLDGDGDPTGLFFLDQSAFSLLMGDN